MSIHEDNHPSEQEQAEIAKTEKSDKIKVSAGRSVFFYVDLATEFLNTHPEVELSGLGYGK